MIRLVFAFVVTVAAGCGRVGFDPRQDATTDSADAAVPVNRAFLSAATVPGNITIAGADALCANEAASAGLPGTFVAFLSTSTTAAPARLAGARGWVRVDGEPVLDQASELAQGRLLNPIELQADGTKIATTTVVWTGTGANGDSVMNGTCNDWSDGSTSANGAAGFLEYGWYYAAFWSALNCDRPQRVYCFQTDHQTPVAPRITAGRIAFVTRSMVGTGGLAAFDAACATEAQTAMLPGTYLAAMSTTTSSIASRFTLDARPWVRPDGTFIASANGLFDDIRRASFSSQLPDGTFTSSYVYTGSIAPRDVGTVARTCNNWVDTGALTAQMGTPAALFGITAWGSTVTVCGTPWPVLCLQE